MLPSRARRLGGLFASNAAGTVLGQVVQLIAIPLQLHHLGASGFGLLVLFNSFVAAGTLTDAGIGPTVMRFVARSQHLPRALSHVVASSFTVILLIAGTVASLGLAGTAAWLAWRPSTLIAGSVEPMTLAGVVVLAVGAAMVSGLALNILRGLRLYRAFAACESILKVGLPTVATVAAVTTHSVTAVLWAICGWVLISAVLCLLYACRRAQVPLRLTTNLRYFRRKMFSFSRWVWAQSLFAYAGSQADRFIVAASMSLAALATYAIAMSVANALLAVMTAGGGFLLPESASRLHDRAWLKAAFLKFTLLFSALSAAAIVVFLPVAPQVLKLWLGAPAALQVLPLLLPLLWTVSNAAASAPGTAILNAMGHSKFAAVAGALANSLILVAMAVGGLVWGVWGVVGAKLLAIPLGFCIRAATAKRIFAMPNAVLVAVGMVWPTLVGTFLILPLSWQHFIRH